MSQKLQKKSRGLVIRSFNYGEADRFCSILCPVLGQIETRARSARGKNSKLATATEFLSLCDFEFFHYKDRYTINSADLVYSFPAIRADIERLTCASHLAELLRDLLLPDELSEQLYELLARAFYALEKDEPAPLAVVHACELRLMAFGGYAVDVNRCALCKEELDVDQTAVFDFSKMAFLCGKHRSGSKHSGVDDLSSQPTSIQELSGGALAALDWFLRAPAPHLFAFKMTKTVEQELDHFMARFLAWNLDKKYTKLDILSQLDTNL